MYNTVMLHTLPPQPNGPTMESKPKVTTNIYYLVVVFIGCLISVYDNALNVIYSDGLLHHEENPVGLWLIGMGGVDFFVLVKAVTTILAALFAIRIVYTKYRVAVLWVLLFQVLLFYYLSFYSPEEFRDKDFLERPPATEVIDFYGRVFSPF